MLELTLSKKHEKVKVDIHTSTIYRPSYKTLNVARVKFFLLIASGFKRGLSGNPCVWKSGRNHFLDQSESSISSGQSDFKVFTNQLCRPIRKGLELLLPGWGSWKWEWRARLWSKDGNHEQSWKTLVEETQEGDFCSLHWHFFCNSWSTFEFFLKLTTLSTPKVCKNLILESNESFYTSTNKTILVFRLFCQPS